LRQQAIQSCQRLGLEQIQLWQLHSIDPKVPRLEHAAVKSLQDDGIIRHAGLSNVSVADLEAALKLFKVATVQNRYNLVDRSSEDVLDYCEKDASISSPGLQSIRVASRTARSTTPHGATPSQIALAWLLKRSPVMVPIPGTSKVAHLEENVAAVEIRLSDEEFATLNREGRAK